MATSVPHESLPSGSSNLKASASKRSDTMSLLPRAAAQAKYFKHVYVFPLSVFVLVPLTVIISYIISVTNGHVLPVFPFISDTGALPPESCIFGQLLNICALLMGICIYLRHCQIVTFYQYSARKHKPMIIISTLLMWLGFIAAFGLSLVANFQENRVISVHVIGAMMAFVVGVIYAWAQSILSFIMKSIMCPLWLAIIRVLLCLAQTGFLVSMNACGGIHHKSANGTSTLPHKFYPSDPGYSRYICSTASEWCMSLAFVCYFLTFAVDFRRCHIIGHQMILQIPVSEMPQEESNTRSIPRYSGESSSAVASIIGVPSGGNSPRLASGTNDRSPASTGHGSISNNVDVRQDSGGTA